MQLKRLLFFAAFVLVASLACAQFRNTNWGMNLEDVIAIEGEGEIRQDEEDTTLVLFDLQLLGYVVAVSFHFYNDELLKGAYMAPVDANIRIHNALTERFGTPRDSSGSLTKWVDGPTEIWISRTRDHVFISYMDFARAFQRAKARLEADAGAF